MKKIILLLLLLSSLAYSQKKYIYIDSLFQNKNDNLVISKVVPFEGRTKAELKNKFKEVASKKFVNLKEITVSETDDNLTLVYIETFNVQYKTLLGNEFIKKEEYTRFQISIKDNKMKFDLYDDGNVFIPGTYGQYPSPAVSARSYYTKDWFKDIEDDKIEIPLEKDIYKPKNLKYQIIIGYINRTKELINYFETEINKKTEANDKW